MLRPLAELLVFGVAPLLFGLFRRSVSRAGGL